MLPECGVLRTTNGIWFVVVVGSMVYGVEGDTDLWSERRTGSDVTEDNLGLFHGRLAGLTTLHWYRFVWGKIHGWYGQLPRRSLPAGFLMQLYHGSAFPRNNKQLSA
jgi:hypothetical protein